MKKRQFTRGSRPNAGIEAQYRAKLEREVAGMARSVLYWMKAAYREHTPVMAMDGGNDGMVPYVPGIHERVHSGDSGHGDHLNRTPDKAIQAVPVMAMDGKNGNNAVDDDIDDMRLHGRFWGRNIVGNEPETKAMMLPDELKEFWNDRNHYVLDGARNRGISGDRDVQMALDRRSPAEFLQAAFRRLAKRWQDRFDKAAPKLARWFATTAARRSDATLQRILKDGGFTVKFTMTPAAKDIIDAAVAENVALIRSIPQQYLTQVEGAVMRSVREGRDLGPLAKELREQYGVTKRRAALIARDQMNKATADMTRARQVEKGYKAIWRHSHAGKVPRPTHVANDGKVYSPVKGWLDPAINKRIWPGTEPNCRCFTQTLIPGFEP